MHKGQTGMVLAVAGAFQVDAAQPTLPRPKANRVYSAIPSRPLFWLVLCLGLVGCVSHNELAYVTGPVENADIQRIFVATTRQPTTPDKAYTAERSTEVHYASYAVSVPPAHQPGQIEWPGKRPDPAKDFMTVNATQLENSAAFRMSLGSEFAHLPVGQRNAVVFVHGFNNSFAEGLYRIVQMSHDLNVGGVKLHYSWPSAGTESGYAYDRDSAAFARDGLEAMLKALAATKVEHIHLVAHSMGSLVVVETLRQAAIARDPNLARKLGGVVLISPDIDVDLFKSQLRRITPLPQPFVIFSSRQDRALQLSALITGEKQRLGNLQSAEDLRGFGVTVVDISDFKSGDNWLNHSSFATSPDLLAILRALPDLDRKLAPQQTSAGLRLPVLIRVEKDGLRLVPDL